MNNNEKKEKCIVIVRTDVGAARNRKELDMKIEMARYCAERRNLSVEHVIEYAGAYFDPFDKRMDALKSLCTYEDIKAIVVPDYDSIVPRSMFAMLWCLLWTLEQELHVQVVSAVDNPINSRSNPDYAQFARLLFEAKKTYGQS
jgi:hypothetical protein